MWTNFDNVCCLDKFVKTGQTLCYDVNIANALLEEKLNDILHMKAPMKTIKSRSSYSSWLSDETKVLMISCDIARDIAKVSNSDNDWLRYRQQE